MAICCSGVAIVVRRCGFWVSLLELFVLQEPRDVTCVAFEADYVYPFSNSRHSSRGRHFDTSNVRILFIN